MMLEIAKLLAAFLGGGLAGSLVAEWFRRKRGRVQHVLLIERVNRLVSPELEGFTLARKGRSTNAPLEEVSNLREYQLTMRNDTPIHLENAEVQFEFPADDVSGVASPATTSRTALAPIDATVNAPWKKAFRWRISHLPSEDSVEFTFRAIAPSSDKYEAVLYQKGVVFKRIIGEPPPKKKTITYIIPAAIVGLLLTLLVLLLTGKLVLTNSGEYFSTVNAGGCELRIVSLSEVYSQRFNSPWQIKHRIFNAGSQDCEIQSKALGLESPVKIKSGDVLEKERISDRPPALVDVEISVGTTNTSRTSTTVPVYVER